MDNLNEQKILQDLIDRRRAIPPIAAPALPSLHALSLQIISTDTRFRRAGLGSSFYRRDAGIAAAEISFYRLLFFLESPNTPWPANPAEYTAFAAKYGTERAIDLGKSPFDAHASKWTDPVDYTHCQALAERARGAGIDVIRYMSARDPGRGFNLALLSCGPFKSNAPMRLQTWRIHLSSSGVNAICEAPKSGVDFGRNAFAVYPRIATLVWNR